MNKYEKMNEELKKDRQQAYAQSCQELESYKRAAAEACQKYNDQIGVINSLRHELWNEISALYKFLKDFGNIGKRITPFEYKTENSRVAGDEERQECGEFVETQKKASKWEGAVKVSAVLLVPTVFPALVVGELFASRSKAKEAYQKNVEQFEKEKIQWREAINKSRERIDFYETATSIANIYRALIATVKDAIQETILPELNGITAFLYADAVKNCIMSQMDPNDAEAASISEYKGTTFHCHYIFVMNSFDYYLTIVKFFTEPILTKIIEDDQITSEEQDDFNRKVKAIEKQTNQLSNSAIFGGAYSE